MNNQQLRAEAERAGVKVGGGRWATIGRSREAQSSTHPLPGQIDAVVTKALEDPFEERLVR